MSKRIRIAVAAATLAGGFAMASGGSASAAHCVSPAGDSPGFSYFGTVHVKGDAHANEGKDKPHAGTPGASNCRDTSGSPSDRAPGRQD